MEGRREGSMDEGTQEREGKGKRKREKEGI